MTRTTIIDNPLRFAALLLLAGCAELVAAQPTDSIYPDTAAVELRGVEIRGTGPRQLLRHSSDGNLLISAASLGEHTTFMGSNDPVAVVRSLASVATANELQASLNVRGGASGANLYLSDGARVVNPMHLLGLYSAYNPSYYRSYGFRAGYTPSVTANTAGAVLEASSTTVPDSTINGQVSIGLIESHGAVRMPIGHRTSAAVGFRRSYLGLLFPDILKLGRSTIKYHFTDINAAVVSEVAAGHTLALNFFGDSDCLSLVSDANGSKDGEFGWRNIVASASWTAPRFEASLQYSGFVNNFVMAEGSRTLDLPSSLQQLTARAATRAGAVDLTTDISYRYTSGQHNRGSDNIGSPSQRATEWNMAASYTLRRGDRFFIDAGLRLSAYFTSGWRCLMPQPRVRLTWQFADDYSLYCSYNRLVRFDRLVEETTAGLPADFWTQATDTFRPENVHLTEIGTAGRIPSTGLQYVVEIYYKRMLHQGEFAGSLLDLTNAGYNPLDDLLDGHGYAVGLSVSLMRQFGKIRGRLAYNLGRTRLKFDRYGQEYFPSSHDRLHDLSAALTWQPLPPLTLGAVFTHATGLPYTRAKYGYMIGENLICEYYPHNSSRLPSYNRLDLSAAWRLTHRHLAHTFTIAVYNAMANRNVLFFYTSYSTSTGISRRESVMKSVIPSLSYTLTF